MHEEEEGWRRRRSERRTMEKVETDRRSRLRSEPSGGKERKVGGGRRRGVNVAAYEIGIVAERERRTTQEPHD
jgi:hypothetical protein